MGKRSDFQRVERDYYPTPIKAVEPLIPHLPPMFTFWEPCAGDFRLVRHLKALTDGCSLIVGAMDVEPRDEMVSEGDALTTPCPESADYIITNPPWDRKILHPMIEHLSGQRPTWLLFDADWMHTKQSAQYLAYCSKIVSVGRVKWIEDSTMTGKDNCAWYLFMPQKQSSIEFVGPEVKKVSNGVNVSTQKSR